MQEQIQRQIAVLNALIQRAANTAGERLDLATVDATSSCVRRRMGRVGSLWDD